MNANVAIRSEQKLQDLGGGVNRRVLAYNKDLMTVEVIFEKGAEGATHTHPHTQCTYVLSGKFEYSVEGESVVLSAGDSIVVSPNLPHGTLCLEAGTLIDTFTPMRDDFING